LRLRGEPAGEGIAGHREAGPLTPFVDEKSTGRPLFCNPLRHRAVFQLPESTCTDLMGTIAYNYSGLVDALNDLKARGYPGDFRVVSCDDSDEDAPCVLRSDTSGKTYKTGQLMIREHYRFEGPSNPDDMSVAYAIECEGGEKGVLVDAYGTYSSRRVGEFLRDIPIEMDPGKGVQHG